jgi:hypothetical protein
VTGWLGRPGTWMEPQIHQRPQPGDDDAQSQQHVRNPHCGGWDDREGHNLSPEGPSPKAFGSVLRNAHFARHFQALGNVIKYDGKTNSSVWLEDCRLLAVLKPNRIMRKCTYVNCSSFHLIVFLGLLNP